MPEGNVSSYGRYQAKRTLYNGVWFKSNLEARVAEALDELGVKWEYETRCFRNPKFEGGQYTPDFWLPDCLTYLEVAGVLDDRHIKNALAFCEVQNINNPLTDNETGCWPQPTLTEEAPAFFFVNSYMDILNPLRMEARILVAECGKHRHHISFVDSEGGYGCRVCGAYEGDHTIMGDGLPASRRWWR